MPVTVLIDTPGAQQEITADGSIEASGTVSPPGAHMSARLRDATATEMQGESKPPRPGQHWSFRFPNAPLDEPLTLTVRGVDPQTSEIGEATRTVRCVLAGRPAENAFTAADESSRAASANLFSELASGSSSFGELESSPVITEAEELEIEIREIEAPAALPPMTVNPTPAAAGEMPEAETARPPAPRRRVRPAARKKPIARKKARVPAGRRPKSAPAKAPRASATRRGRPVAKKGAPVAARKPAKKLAAKAGKTAPKKAVKVSAKKNSRPAPKKSAKAKTAKAAASGARRGTKPSPRKTSKAAAKTNPKRRHSR